MFRKLNLLAFLMAILILSSLAQAQEVTDVVQQAKA